MSVLENIRKHVAATSTPNPANQQQRPEPGRTERQRPEIDYGLETEDIGEGLRRWTGWVDEALAAKVLEANQLNRPLSSAHATRIAKQMTDSKWKTNGETIKIADNGDVMDGQHRLWAVIYSKRRVWLIFIFGVDKEAFSTIDTICKSRSGADILAVSGLGHHRQQTSGALTWLIRYQRRNLPEIRTPEARVENSDIEEAFANHPDMVRAVQEVGPVGRMVTPALIAFVYYVLASQDLDLANRLLKTLQDPAGVALVDPFYKLREFLVNNYEKRRNPVMTLALIIKAVNAAHEGRTLEALSWRSQGEHPEAFPTFWFAP